MAYTGEVADLYVILRAVTKPFTDSMAKAGAEGEAAGSRIGGGLGKISPVLKGITAGTGIALAASVKFASDFETQYTRLYTAAGASKTAVLANRDAMLQLGTTTGYTGTQIAEALYHPVSAGLDMATALQVVKYSAQEARISGANLDDTTYSLSSVMKAFNLNAKDAGGTMSLLNAIVGDGDMRFQDFNASIKNWAPTSAQMGISIQSMGSALSYLTDRGNSAEEASTRVTMGLTMMATPSKQATKLLEGLGVASGDVKASSDAMTQVLKETGITQNQLAKDLQQPDGIYVALNHVKTALKDAGVSGTEADSVLSKIFGGGRSDKAIMSLMQNLDGLKQKYDQIGVDSSGKKFQQNWEDAQKTTAVQFDKLKAAVMNLGIQLGEKLLPIVKEFLGWIASGITWVTKHKEAMIALAGVISGVVVAALYSMGAAFVATAAEAMANPIVDIVAALALAAIEVVTHWKQVKKFFEDMWAWVMDHKKLFEIILAPLLVMIVPVVLAIKEIIKHWQAIWDFLKRLGPDIVQWGKDIAKFFSHMWDDLSKWFSDAWTKAVAVAKGIWKGMQDAWNDTVHFLERIWNDTGGKVVHEIAKDWSDSTAAVSKEWHHISDDLSSIWDSLTSIWDHTGGKLVHYISDAMSWVSGEIHKHWAGIKDYLVTIWGVIYGYIRGVLEIIKGILRAGWDFIKGLTKTVWDIIWNVIKTVWDLIWGIIKTTLDVIKGIMSAAWDVIKGIVKTVWDLISGIINTALDYIKDVLKLFADFFSGHWSKLWGDMKKIAGDLWHNIWSTIGNVLKDIIGTVVKAAGDMIHGFWQALEDGVKTVLGGIKDIWNAIIGFFKDVGHWLYQAGKDLIQGLINGIGDMADSAAGAVKHVAGKVWDSAKHGFGLWSPSHIAYGHGQMIVQGLINGLNSMSDQAGNTMLDLANGVMGNMAMGTTGSRFPGSPIIGQGSHPPGDINIYVQGSVLTDRDLRDVVQEQMLQLGARYSTSYTPYKR